MLYAGATEEEVTRRQWTLQMDGGLQRGVFSWHISTEKSDERTVLWHLWHWGRAWTFGLSLNMLGELHAVLICFW